MRIPFRQLLIGAIVLSLIGLVINDVFNRANAALNPFQQESELVRTLVEKGDDAATPLERNEAYREAFNLAMQLAEKGYVDENCQDAIFKAVHRHAVDRQEADREIKAVRQFFKNQEAFGRLAQALKDTSAFLNDL